MGGRDAQCARRPQPDESRRRVRGEPSRTGADPAQCIRDGDADRKGVLCESASPTPPPPPHLFSPELSSLPPDIMHALLCRDFPERGACAHGVGWYRRAEEGKDLYSLALQAG
jgi:hypothetical protein